MMVKNDEEYRCTIGVVPQQILRSCMSPDSETEHAFHVNESQLIKMMFEYVALQNMATRCMGAA